VEVRQTEQIKATMAGKFPWFKSGELNDSIITMSEEFITEEGLNNSSAKVFPKGTLLVAMYGATAGKTAILDIDAATNQAICAVVPKNKSIRKDFLFWFLRAHRYYYIDISRGGAQPNISQTVIKNTEVPLIDENEQKSIVEFLTRIEKTKEINYSLIPKQLHKTIKLAFEHLDCLQKLENENLNQSSYFSFLRQSILQEAIEGKLTAKWRKTNSELISGDNHASKLLEKIKAEKERLTKSTKGAKNAKALPPISEEKKPFDLPEGWAWCRLGEAAQGFEYGSSAKSIKTGKVPVLRMGNLQDGVVVWENLVYTNDDGEIQQYLLMSEDLLFNRTNSRELVGKTALFDCEEKAIYAGYIVRFHMCGQISAHFSNYVMNSIYHRKWCNMVKADALGQSNINATKLREFVFPLPPLAEQQAIVDCVEKLVAMIDELEKQVSARKEQSEMLMQSVLREAFAKG